MLAVNPDRPKAPFYETGGLPPRTPAPGSAAAQRPSAGLLVAIGLLLPGLLAYTLATGNESRVLALVLALLGMLVIIARPYWGLIFFVALLYTRPEEIIPALQGMRLPLIISLVTLAALVFQKLLSREPAVQTPLVGMMAGFSAAVVLSTFSLGNTGQAVQDVAKLLILVVLVVNLVNTPARYRGFVTALLAFTAYLAAYSIYLYFSGGAMQYQDMERSRATGIFSDPNDLAATIVAGLALALARIRGARTGARLLYLGLAGVMIWAILLTNSRGGMLALLTVAGGFLFVFTRRKTLAAVLAVLVAGAFLVLGPSRMTSFDAGEESANSRFWFWVNGVEQMAHRPLLGVGYGGFPDLNDGMTAHNSFVLCFAETGLIGYFFWMGCIYCCFKRPSESASSPTGEENAAEVALERQGLLGARLALAGFLVAAFWISRTYVPVLYLLLSLPVVQQIACATAPGRAGTGSGRWRQQDWGRIALICVGSILGIYLLALRLR